MNTYCLNIFKFNSFKTPPKFSFWCNEPEALPKNTLRMTRTHRLRHTLCGVKKLDEACVACKSAKG